MNKQDIIRQVNELDFTRAKLIGKLELLEELEKESKEETKDQIASMCKDETILNAKQALEIGLIDMIHEG